MRHLSLPNTVKTLAFYQFILCFVFLIWSIIQPQHWGAFGASLICVLITGLHYRVFRRGGFLNARAFFGVMIFLEILKILLIFLGILALLFMGANPKDLMLGLSVTYLTYFLLLFKG